MKTYLKLIGLEFNCKKVEKAKQIYKQHIRELGIEASGKHWEVEDDKCTIQLTEIFSEPKLVKVPFNEKITLVYSLEQFRLKEEAFIKKIQDYELQL